MPARILVVEDDPRLRADARLLLTERGYEVAGESADGESAVSLAVSLRPDVVLMAIDLPGRNGFWAADQISRARLAAVILTATAETRPPARRAAAAGAFGYAIKPHTERSLIPMIEVA